MERCRYFASRGGCRYVRVPLQCVSHARLQGDRCRYAHTGARAAPPPRPTTPPALLAPPATVLRGPIPGFYFDEEKQKYFKLPPGGIPPTKKSSAKPSFVAPYHVNIATALRKRETQRQPPNNSPDLFSRMFSDQQIVPFDSCKITSVHTAIYPDTDDLLIYCLLNNLEICVLDTVSHLGQLTVDNITRHAVGLCDHLRPHPRDSAICLVAYSGGSQRAWIGTHVLSSSMAMGVTSRLTLDDCTVWTCEWNEENTSRVAGGTSDGIALLDVERWSLIAHAQFAKDMFTLEFMPGSDIIACGSRDGFIRLWDSRARASPLVFTSPNMPSPVCRVAVGSNGFSLLSAHADGQLKMWDSRTCRLVRSFGGVTREGLRDKFAFDRGSDTIFGICPSGTDAFVWRTNAQRPSFVAHGQGTIDAVAGRLCPRPRPCMVTAVEGALALHSAPS